MEQQTVVTRIAPSPTGEMHIGTVRTALFNYLFAKQHGGTYFARIEDTDRARNKEEWVEAIWRDFTWCGLEPDAKYRTSDYAHRHQELLQALVDTDKAYVSREPKKDDPSQNIDVVRLRNPGRKITFTDLIRGDVSFDTAELGDFVIARSVDDPLFHFAVVVDDDTAGVTHVIRAEEHISNTPRQILILEALGFSRPTYGHLPLILAPDRSKLSKRKHGASIELYRKNGYLAPAIINYLALLGWNPGTAQELFSLEELICSFKIEQVQKSGAVFDGEKLKWFNREYQKLRNPHDVRAELLIHLESYPAMQEIAEHSDRAAKDLLDRYAVFGDLVHDIEAGEFSFYLEEPRIDPKKLAWKKDPSPEKVRERLEHLIEIIAPAEDFTYESLASRITPYADAEGKGNVLWPLRYALSGKERSPDPFLLLEALGKEESLERIRAAIAG